MMNKYPSNQTGSSLVVILMMLTIIFLAGVSSSKMALFGERSARNERDRQVAFEAAEAALLDAEIDMMGPNSKVGNRVCLFDAVKPTEFVEGCGQGIKAGMCLNTASTGDAWKVVKSLYTTEIGAGSLNKTVEYGQHTGQTFLNGASGLPSKLPRYTIEVVPYAGTGSQDDNVGSATTAEYGFLVTAMGFGINSTTQVVLQTLVYKPTNKPTASCL